MKKEFELKMVRMPNFISTNMTDNNNKEVLVPVENLSQKEALLYAEEMRAAFIAHWKTKTANPNSLK